MFCVYDPEAFTCEALRCSMPSIFVWVLVDTCASDLVTITSTAAPNINATIVLNFKLFSNFMKGANEFGAAALAQPSKASGLALTINLNCKSLLNTSGCKH